MEERAKLTELPNPEAPRLPVVEECTGCHYVFTKQDGAQVCIPYSSPIMMWRRKVCIMATNQVIEKTLEKKVNPLKASKKAKKGA